MKTKTRRNSLESLNSSSESIEDSDSEEDERLVRTLLKGGETLQSSVVSFGGGEKKLLRAFPQYDHFHSTKSKQEQSPVLCSIPEADVIPTRVEIVGEKHSLHISTDNTDILARLEEKTLDEDIIKENDTLEKEITTTASIWSLLTILSFISRCILVVICISTIFVIFVLLTHQHSRYLSHLTQLITN